MESTRRRQARNWGPLHGKQVRRLREGKGWTQDDLADQVSAYGVEQIRAWENGEHQPQSRYQKTLAKALDISVHDLLHPRPNIPPIPRGLTVFQMLPVAERRSAVFLPVLEQLESEKCECLPLDEFDIARFWEEFEFEVGLLDELGKDRALSGWAKVVGRAIVLSGFQGFVNDPQEAKSSWSRYRQLIRRVRDRCRLVVIQAVNPIHGPDFNSASSRAVTPQRQAFIPRDPAILAEQLLSELPDCCLKAVRDVLKQPAPRIDEICSSELIDSGILRREKGAYYLVHESWREPWTKRL